MKQFPLSLIKQNESKKFVKMSRSQQDRYTLLFFEYL
jgi:hypothetical protein